MTTNERLRGGETTNESKQQDERSNSTCPECDGCVTYDGENSERTCEQCGLVVSEDELDRGPEWRAFDPAERQQKSRVGAPTSNLFHDKGLSTNIGWQDKDAHGRTLSARKRERLQRLRTWDERFRTKDAHERNIKQALGEITRMGSALGLSEQVQETAGVMYKRAVKDDLLPGRSIEGMATAALYAATRQHGTPRPQTEFASVSRVEKLDFQRAYRYLSRELSLQIKPEDPTEYVPQFASSLDLSDEAIRMARELLSVGKKQALHSGKSPAGMAAAAIYAAAQLTNEQLTQEEVSNAAHVSRVTIRSNYTELLEAYGEHS